MMNHVPTLHTNALEEFLEAVRTLNTLQSNAAFLERVRSERDKKRHLSLPETIETCCRAGVSLDALDQLRVIHVSGTKGKGSTCAFIESILRGQGYKTGFFSSPHLVEVRERIRLNGHPISREAFSSYFWDIYRRLDASKEEYGGNMPMYFRFLTVMAAHVFIEEKVDVAILEVGIGGEYDCTNIVRRPAVCAVTSLGLDHTGILGTTLEKIAWHKAGIFKDGVPAFTVEQPEGCLEILKTRAQEKKAPLYLVSHKLPSYTGEKQVSLGIPGAMQALNASLAVQVCDTWLQQRCRDIQNDDLYAHYLKEIGRDGHIMPCEHKQLSASMIQGLQQCRWLGRSQTLYRDRVTYYLDGAHTTRSLEACAQWFLETSAEETKKIKGPVVRMLLFNTTGERQPEQLLQPLLDCNFQYAMFCPNIVAMSCTNTADQTNLTVTKENQLHKCVQNMNVWVRLLANHSIESTAILQSVQSSLSKNSTKLDPITSDDQYTPPVANSVFPTSSKDICDSGIGSEDSSSRATPEHQTTLSQSPATHFTSVTEAILWISQNKSSELLDYSGCSPPEDTLESQYALPTCIQQAAHVQVLCTGSLHLIGGILGLLDPALSGK